MQDTLVTDILLLNLLAAGDQEAFQQIYEKYWYRLYRIIKAKVKVEAEAEEMVQDIFVDIWERRHRLEISDLKSYLYSAAKYKVLNYIKAQIIRRTYQKDRLETQVDCDSNTEQDLAFSDLKSAIANGIEDLPSKTRDIFNLNRLEDKSVKEVSLLLGIPERTVEYHVNKALSTLRIHLRDFTLLLILLL
ncbi:RNA polymerase sigma-70 factor (ECF subfamily) [Dyadobacter jejuensis]|uniref:RNA polymerase sigma-70 factor (ECF subfamily) n=1 Tax=Dyadobacter jejuensis TaxID=1082580 RepID=A0A316AG93_9BACT|nr:RNA polymerase sigma-70 factor [Dyadobacter jejuensis]PWJ55934.1 RNA polymerase sigma-70 factor (ECF subfamily) [Dyadobacter jejuensis]